MRPRISALVLNLTLSLVLQSDQVSAGQRHAAPLARLHTDTRLKNKVCAIQEHKNALWNPIFNTKCHNELWENLEWQQEPEEKALLTWALGFFRGATAEDHRSPGALTAAVEGAHSSRSSGEKQTDPDHAAGKTKGGIHKSLRAPAGIFDKSEPTRSCYCWHSICHRELLRSLKAVSACSFQAARLQVHPGLPCIHIFLHLVVTLAGGRSKHLLPVLFQVHWLPRMVKMSNYLGCATFKHPRTGGLILPGIWHNANSRCDEGIWNESLDLAVCFSS